MRETGERETVKKEIIVTSEAGGSWTNTTAHGVKAGSFVFVTGQLANKPGTTPGPADAGLELGSLEEQTRQVLDNVGAILKAAGTSFDNVVKRNIYYTHPLYFQPIFKIFEEYFPSRVASTGVIVGLIPATARLELDVIAIIPDSDE
jgi:2-iminobutanoate/2-iminopropanoate deaminase